jgi:Protein of unknown function (DUF1566)
LIVSLFDQGKDIAWNNGNLAQTGAFGKEIYDGDENTKTIVTKVGEGTYPAKLCDTLVWKGYSDWYLPSKEELNELYNQSKAIGGFAKEYYWSSTEISNKDVFYRSFFNGHAYEYIKGNKAHVRAIRSF